MDLFTTRTMLPMVDLSIGSNNFLRSRYFGNVAEFDTAVVDVDIIKPQARKVAPFVNPKAQGVTVENEGFRTVTYEAPQIAVQKVTDAEEMMNKRMPGETLYSGRSPLERAAEKLGRDLRELHEMITRAEEVMCSEALFTGALTIKGTGYDTKIDFWDASNKPSAAASTKWDASGATAETIFKDCRSIRRTMLQKGGVAPTEMIVGKNVIEALLSKLSSADQLDTRRVELGNIDPQMQANGVTYWGRLKDSAIDIITYDEWYIDSTGAEVPVVPNTSVLFASPNAKTTMCYGCVSYADPLSQQLMFVPGSRVPFSWVSREAPAGRVVQLKSRPLPIINNPWGFYVLTGVTNS